MKRMLFIVVAALATGSGCKDDTSASAPESAPTYGPVITAEQMPTGLQSLVFGESTEAEVEAALGSPSKSADTSLGGDMSVMLNDDPAITLKTETAEAWLVRRGEGAKPTLTRLVVKDDGLCDRLGGWLQKQDEATRCPGSNRSLGQNKRGWTYCAAGPKADRNLVIECDQRGVEYWLR